MYGSLPFSENDSYSPIREPKNVAAQSTLSPNAREFIYQPQQRNPIVNSEMAFPPFQPPNHVYHQMSVPMQLPLEQQQQQQQQQQAQQHHRSQNFGNSHNGYQQIRAPYQQHRHHHHNNHNFPHHHQQQQQQQQQQHYQHNFHQQSQRVNALTSDVQDRLKISNHAGNNRPSSYNYNSQVNQQQRPNTHQSQQSRLKYNNYPSTSAASKEAANNDMASASASNSNASEMETVALDYLSSVIKCLNSNPGQYDTVATQFLNIFEGLEDNNYVLSIAMEEIFSESIQNPNFRYMGAKLYHLLHMLNLKKDSLFLVLLKCKLDDFQREVCEYMEKSEHDKVREATLFLAELYMQLRGDDSRIHLLAENIVFSLRQLLGTEMPDNVRCICMTLKLAGYDLTNDCPQEISEIITYLQNINERSPGKYPIIASVLTLSKENWGRKLSSSASFSETELHREPPRSSDEPIFYGPDGRELTAEETDFLTGGLNAGPGGSTDEDDEVDLEEFDLEMDEEASKAYKEFLKHNVST